MPGFNGPADYVLAVVLLAVAGMFAVLLAKAEIVFFKVILIAAVFLGIFHAGRSETGLYSSGAVCSMLGLVALAIIEAIFEAQRRMEKALMARTKRPAESAGAKGE